MVDLYRGMSDQLQDSSITRIFLVLNPDELSLAESQLIWKELTSLGMKISYLIINKSKPEDAFLGRVEGQFRNARLLVLPTTAGGELTGLKELDSVELPMDIEEV